MLTPYMLIVNNSKCYVEVGLLLNTSNLKNKIIGLIILGVL